MALFSSRRVFGKIRRSLFPWESYKVIAPSHTIIGNWAPNCQLRSKAHTVPTAPLILHRTRIDKCATGVFFHSAGFILQDSTFNTSRLTVKKWICKSLRYWTILYIFRQRRKFLLSIPVNALYYIAFWAEKIDVYIYKKKTCCSSKKCSGRFSSIGECLTLVV